MHEFAQMQVELANQVKALKEENEAIRAENKSLWATCVSLTEQTQTPKKKNIWLKGKYNEDGTITYTGIESEADIAYYNKVNNYVVETFKNYR